jgi:hemerythrin-like metal-binding protein
MALFEWTQEYSVSVQRFDTEHKKLFALISELNDAMAEGRGRYVAARVLQELNEYAHWHFRGEESAMERTGYAGLEGHKAEHREFLTKIEGFYSGYDGSQTGVTIDVLYFLRDWLLNHILHTDRQYAECLNHAGIH